MVLNGEDGQCECTSCQMARLTDIVKNLVERVSLLEELRLLDIEGDVEDNGKVVWRDKE